MSKEVELKPCPACGGFDLRVGYNCVSDKHFVICCRCMMRGPENEGSKNNARKAWNSVAKREVADLAASDADCLKEMVRSLALKMTKSLWARHLKTAGNTIITKRKATPLNRGLYGLKWRRNDDRPSFARS